MLPSALSAIGSDALAFARRGFGLDRLGRRRAVGGCGVFGLGGCGRLPQRGRVLVPVGLAHPAEPVLLAGLDREVARPVPRAPRSRTGSSRCTCAGLPCPSSFRSRPPIWRPGATSITLFARRCKAGRLEMTTESPRPPRPGATGSSATATWRPTSSWPTRATGGSIPASSSEPWPARSTRSAGWPQVLVNRTTGHVVDGHLRVELAISPRRADRPGAVRRALRGRGAARPRHARSAGGDGDRRAGAARRAAGRARPRRRGPARAPG